MFKVYLGIGNIALDMGYIAFAIALYEFNISGTVVGVIGCAIESILFTANGFSISWVVANTIIGICCGLVFRATDKLWIRIIAVLGSCILGLLVIKTAIECTLFSIPLAVKIPKNAVACAADAAVMLIGLWLAPKLHKKV